jgi:hypothetical protein
MKLGPPKLNVYQIDNNRERDTFLKKLGTRPNVEFLDELKEDFMHQQVDNGPFFVTEFDKNTQT